VVCRWSDLGLPRRHLGSTAAEELPRVGVDCCEIILRVLLEDSAGLAAEQPRGGEAASSWSLRLQVCLTVLSAGGGDAAAATSTIASPQSTAAVLPTLSAVLRAEHAALRLAACIAEWLMQSCAPRVQELLPATASSRDAGAIASTAGGKLLTAGPQRQQLAFEALAWPLCKRVLAAAPRYTHRGLCLLYFCRRSLGPVVPLPLQRRSHLHDFFETLLLNSPSATMCSLEGLGTACGSTASAALLNPLWDEARDGPRLSTSSSSVSSEEALLASSQARPQEETNSEARHKLARMFVEVWMQLVPATQRPEAYELLAKLGAQHLLAALEAKEEPPAAKRSKGEEAADAPSDLVLALLAVLVEAISYRNAQTLSTESWSASGTALPDLRGDALRGQPAEIRSALEASVSALVATKRSQHQEYFARTGGSFARLLAMLPLL